MLKNIRSFTMAAIIIASSALFSGLIYREYLALEKYMYYIVENGKSALFYEQYINQRVALRLSSLFSALPAAKPGVDDEQTICRRLEHVNGMSGINLTAASFKRLSGTLQTKNPDCRSWAQDLPAFIALDDNLITPPPEFSFSNYSGYIFDKQRYYVDLDKSYVYSTTLVDTRRFVFPFWLSDGSTSLNVNRYIEQQNINPQAFSTLLQGKNITTHIYFSHLLNKNALSIIYPVFANGMVKGTIVKNIDAYDLATAFYTSNRKLLWSSLHLFISDDMVGKNILFHIPGVKSISILNFNTPLTSYYTLHIHVELWYFVLSTLWLVGLYILTTVLLCRYAGYHLDRHANLSQDNMTDALTGLYNRKLLTEAFKRKISGLIRKNIAIAIIAIDCDGLKKINDTLGHHTGDKVIHRLGSAIASSVRRSDYGIRIGGDEFMLILVDANKHKAHEVIQRVAEKLKTLDEQGIISFSWGSHQMDATDALEDAFIQADKCLYQHKYGKRASQDRE